MNSARFLMAVFSVACVTSTGPAHSADITRGAEIYRQHCASCHGASGNSSWPGAPDLARREGLLRTDQALVQILRTGRGAKPGFQGLISDADLLNVVAYSRTLLR